MTADRLPPVKFLLVDDVPENLQALEALLARDGLELHMANTGPEALELLMVHDFALALLDVQMPGMDGYELAELMRGAARSASVPIAFLTAVATDERRRFRGYATGAVDYILKPIDPHILLAKTAVFFELARQRQELARQRDDLKSTADALAAALDRLHAHSDNSPLASLELDAALTVVAWSGSAERLFGRSEAGVLGKRLEDLRLVADESWLAFEEHLQALLTGKESRGVQGIQVRAKGEDLDCECYTSVLFDRAGQPMSLHVQMLDVTDKRRAERVQELLVGELNHRVKNTLATVQAIAAQSLRHAVSPEAFQDAFSGRIQALSRAHSLLSQDTWQGAMLSEIVNAQLELGAIDADRFQVAGPEVSLPAPLALHLALILHEFVTNAVKYGALSTPKGRVALTWFVEEDALNLEWAESGGPPVTAPTRKGFGSRLIEQSTRSAAGEARVAYRAEGICWNLTLSLPSLPQGEQSSFLTKPTPSPSRPPRQHVDKASDLVARRILIVEDEPLVGLELTTLLDDWGAEVIGPVGTVEDALQAVGTGDLDAVLLDANLSGRPVDEIAAALTRRTIPFVFVTGYGPESLPQSFRHAPHLSKPFTRDDVRQALIGLVCPKGMQPDVVTLAVRGGQDA